MEPSAKTSGEEDILAEVTWQHRSHAEPGLYPYFAHPAPCQPVVKVQLAEAPGTPDLRGWYLPEASLSADRFNMNLQVFSRLLNRHYLWHRTHLGFVELCLVV